MYISEGRYVTAVVYALMLQGAAIIPSTVDSLTTTELQESFNAFEASYGQIVEVVDTDDTAMNRVMYSSVIYLDRPIVTSDIAQIQNNLKSAWIPQLTGTVSISIDLQESLIKDNGYDIFNIKAIKSL